MEGYYRFPSVSTNGQLTFTSDSSLWLTTLPSNLATLSTQSSAQLPASRLTPGGGGSTTGAVTFGSLSPGGERVAMVSSHEGGATDLFVLPTQGGTLTRLTYEGNAGDDGVGSRGGLVACSWYQDQVLYATPYFSTLPDPQLVLSCASGSGNSRLLPLAQASDGCFASCNNVTVLFFCRCPFQGSQTRRYKGGTAQQLWRVDLSDNLAPLGEATALTADFPGTSKRPMWSSALQRLFFLSDRGEQDETMNLWSSDANGKALRQHTNYSDFEIRWASLADTARGAARVVFSRGADLLAIDISAVSVSDSVCGSEAAQIFRLPIILAGALDQRSTHTVENPLSYLSSLALSAGGERVALTLRGRLFVAPTGAAGGRVIEVGGQKPDKWKQCEFLPTDKASKGVVSQQLLAIGSATGEEELWLLPVTPPTAGGGAEPVATQLTHDGHCQRQNFVLSPTGQHAAVVDSERNLWILAMASGKSSRIHTAVNYGSEHTELAWAPDGNFLAFVTAAENTFDQIMIFELATGAITAATSDRSQASSPSWAADGRYLFFLSDRNLVNLTPSPWGARAPEPSGLSTRQDVFALALGGDVTRFGGGKRPVWEEEDELMRPMGVDNPDNIDDDDDDENDKNVKDEQVSPLEHVVVIAGGVSAAAKRLYQLPVEAADYSTVTAGAGSTLFLRKHGTLSRVDLSDPTKMFTLEDVAKGVRSMCFSADRSQILLLLADNQLHLVDAHIQNFKPAKKSRVDLSGLRVGIDPRAERASMFDDAWRLQRDLFFDKNMHGVDWNAAKQKYQTLLPRVHDRHELNDVLAQLTAEISALHHFVRGGDHNGAGGARSMTNGRYIPAHLGGVLRVREMSSSSMGGVLVERVYRGDPERPMTLSPLELAGVEEGDILVSVNGVQIDSTQAAARLGQLLLGTAGQQVRLGLYRHGPSGGSTTHPVEKQEDVTIVKPISSAECADLRYLDWELSRNRQTQTLGGDDIAYVHLRAMGGDNYAEFAAQFYPVYNRSGLILAVRHNRGGNIDSWILEKLLRKCWFFWAPRGGQPHGNMQYAFRGHIVVLMNEETASDGEAFAEGARRLGLATLIGRRTWGGEIWLSASDFTLQGGGVASAGQTGVYDTEGQEWLIEGWGVEPDIECDNPPVATFGGEDAQLTAAVVELQRLIAQAPVATPLPPPYPIRAAKNSLSKI